MKKRILIVEDEKILQDVYKMLLESRGYTVYTADNGVEGIKQLKLHDPQLVLLDIFMPVMDGKEFLRNIDVNDYPGTTFIACTNLSDSATEAEMVSLGALKLVLKASMGPTELIGLVDGTLAAIN